MAGHPFTSPQASDVEAIADANMPHKTPPCKVQSSA